MKQFKPALICIAVLVVISIAAFAVIKFLPEAEDLPQDTGESPALSESVEILSFKTEEIASIEISADDGKSFAIDYSGEGVYRTAKMRNANEKLAYEEDQMIIFSQYFTPLVALDEIGTGDDASFGFDTPRRRISVYSVSGEAKTLLLGDDLPVGDGAYVRCADDDTVYSIGPTVRGLFLKEMTDYREVGLFEGVSDSSVITMAEYAPAGKAPIKIVLKSEKEIEQDEQRFSITIPYRITSPVVANTDPGAVTESFLDKIIKITGSRVAEDNPSDLSKYGLSAPSRLRFETDEGVSVSLLIGKDSVNGGTYVMEEGVPSVIETTEKVSLDSLSHTDIIQKLLWFFAAEELSGFDYKLSDGTAHTFSFSSKDGEAKGSFDGKELSGRNPQNLYMKTVRFSIAGEQKTNEAPGNPEITITAHLRGGKTSSLGLCGINERQYAVLVDGKDTGYYVHAAEVSELLDAISLASRGEDIPNMF